MKKEVLRSIQYAITLIWILFWEVNGLLEGLMKMVIFVTLCSTQSGFISPRDCPLLTISLQKMDQD